MKSREGSVIVRAAAVLLAFGSVVSVAVPSLSPAAGNRPATVHAYEVRDVPKRRVYIPCQSASEDEIIALRRRLIHAGAEKVNLFFPSVIVCEMAVDRTPEDMIGDPRFSCIDESQIDAGSSPSVPDAVRAIRSCYERAAMLASNPALAAPDGFEDRVLIVPPERVAASTSYVVDGSGPSLVAERNMVQNSEFMIGDILIRLVYPESRGVSENSEDWTDKELRDVNQGAVSGALAFQERFDYLPMDFVFTTHQRIETRYEPIQHNMNDDAGTWIFDVMETLGYGIYRDAGLMTHTFNNDGRRRFGTDWVYTAFIADSRNEPGNIFSGRSGGAGYTAYANLGGPYLVIPFPAGANNPNGITEILLFSQIFQHEMVHIFWGLDEYPAAPSDCGSHTGYLDFDNRNKLTQFQDEPVRGCPDYVNCLMWNARAAESDGRPICFFTAGQIGVVDVNENGIPDVFDRAPTLEFEGAPAETVATPDITVKMKAISLAVPNINPFHKDPIDYAAPLKDATLTVDGVGSTPLKPIDGRWDEGEEDLTFALQGLAAGLTRIQVRVRNVFGATSAQIVKEIYFIGVKFAHFSVIVNRDRIDVDWQTVGETFGARFDLYRIESGPSEGDPVLVWADAKPENPGALFQHFSYDDTDITAGHEYAYYIIGDGETPDFETHSNVLKVKAMLPMASGEAVSHVAPNPFRETTTISIDVPKTFDSDDVDDYAASSAIPREVPTDVTIDVYDVTGRRVKEIYAGKMFSRVETFVWDGTNSQNERIPSGIYFVRARAGSVQEVRKVVVVR